MNDIERRPDEAHAAPAAASPQRRLVLTAFAIVYLVWGSMYLAILFATPRVSALNCCAEHIQRRLCSRAHKCCETARFSRCANAAWAL